MGTISGPTRLPFSSTAAFSMRKFATTWTSRSSSFFASNPVARWKSSRSHSSGTYSLRCGIRVLPARHAELLYPLAAVLRHIHVAARIHRDAVRLVEFARKVSRAAEASEDFSALPLQDLDARIVLVDHIH